jgi:hypothetical protein
VQRQYDSVVRTWLVVTIAADWQNGHSVGRVGSVFASSVWCFVTVLPHRGDGFDEVAAGSAARQESVVSISRGRFRLTFIV